jgi:hypothetical protein
VVLWLLVRSFLVLKYTHVYHYFLRFHFAFVSSSEFQASSRAGPDPTFALIAMPAFHRFGLSIAFDSNSSRVRDAQLRVSLSTCTLDSWCRWFGPLCFEPSLHWPLSPMLLCHCYTTSLFRSLSLVYSSLLLGTIRCHSLIMKTAVCLRESKLSVLKDMCLQLPAGTYFWLKPRDRPLQQRTTTIGSSPPLLISSEFQEDLLNNYHRLVHSSPSTYPLLLISANCDLCCNYHIYAHKIQFSRT